MDIEDSYIVRILRHTPPDGQDGAQAEPPGLSGYVERPGTGRRHGFHSIEELWVVLAESVPAPLENEEK